jgi:predicted dienelactone hydrolase
LTLLGGIPDLTNIASHCRKHPDDAEFCRSGNPTAPEQQAMTDTATTGLSDPRFKAGVLLAPVGVPFNSKHSLSSVKAPIRIYRAEKDNVLRYPYHAETVRKNLHNPPEFVEVKDAGHFSFIAQFPEMIRDSVGEVSTDPAGFDRNVFHQQMNREIVEFLSRALSR